MSGMKWTLEMDTDLRLRFDAHKGELALLDVAFSADYGMTQEAVRKRRYIIGLRLRRHRKKEKPSNKISVQEADKVAKLQVKYASREQAEDHLAQLGYTKRCDTVFARGSKRAYLHSIRAGRPPNDYAIGFHIVFPDPQEGITLGRRDPNNGRHWL